MTRNNGLLSVSITLVLVFLSSARGDHDSKINSVISDFEEGTKLKEQGKLAEAEVFLERARIAKESRNDSTPPLLATILHKLGALYLNQGRTEKAEKNLLRAASLTAKGAGQNLDLARIYNDLGITYQSLGAYAKSEEHHKKALEIRSRLTGSQSEATADSFFSMGNVLWEEQKWASAEQMYKKAEAIYWHNPGPGSTKLADVWVNLANIYGDLWRFNEAEERYKNGLSIYNSQPNLSFSLKQKIGITFLNLASLYESRGDKENAEASALRAYKLFSSMFGKRHQQTLVTMNMLGVVYMEKMQYDKALPLMQEVLTLRKEILPNTHPSISSSLREIGSIYYNQGMYHEALKYYNESLSRKNLISGRQKDKFSLMLDMAGAYAALGEFSKSEHLAKTVAASDESPLPRTMIDSFGLLGYLSAMQGRHDKVVGYFRKSLNLSENLIAKEGPFMSPLGISNLAAELSDEQDRLFSALMMLPRDSSMADLAMRYTLLRKGRLLESERDLLIPLTNTERAHDPRIQRIRDLRVTLSNLALSGQTEDSGNQKNIKVITLLNELALLQGELAKSYADFSTQRSLPRMPKVLEAVDDSLPSDSALVEFVEFNALRIPGNVSRDTSQPTYGALVMRTHQTPNYVNLGNKKDIDSLIEEAMLDILKQSSQQVPGSLIRLYEALWHPLERHVSTVRRVVIVPDGAIAVVPFSALHTGTEYLTNLHSFQYLTTGRDLLRKRPASSNRPVSDEVFVFADPAFDTQPAERLGTSGAAQLRSARLASASLTPLPGTREEAATIKRLLPMATVLTGSDANEARLQRLQAPSILHIATHGFYISGTEEQQSASRSLSMKQASAPQDPLLRSILALAGAAVARASQQPGDEQDGLVTALELSSINLWGTQLVVLSACNTGRGDARRSDGLYGLRRAAVIAGAETLVSSLWKVDDTVTKDLMKLFYLNLLAGVGRVEAMHQAAREIRKIHPQPYYWAPFIVTGQDGPLRDLPRTRSGSMPPTSTQPSKPVD